MKPFSNGLTPAEAERLAWLLEEMGEAQQAIGKVLRHGYESRHPDGGPSNREHLTEEIGHVRAAITLLVGEKDVSGVRVVMAMEAKLHRVWRWLHHQEGCD